MTNGVLPTTITGSSRDKIVLIAIGLAILAGGILMIVDTTGSLVGRGMLGNMSPSRAGWFVSLIGLVLVIGALIMVARGCPRLELQKKGILYSRCLQGSKFLAWQDLREVKVRTSSVPRSTGDEIIFDAVVLISTDGQETEIASLAPATEIYQKLKVAASLVPAQINFI